MHDAAFIIAGFGVGLVVGLSGVGGGSLMTPVLIFLLGVKTHVAVGTDLLFAAFTKLGGTVRLARSGLVDWPIVLRLCAGSIPASLLTLLLLRHLGPATAQMQHLMTSTLGIALLLTAAATLYKALRGRANAAPAPPRGTASLHARHWSLPLLLGALVGTLVTLTSVGAGAIGVSVLLFIYPRLPLPRVVAADIACAVPLTLLAGLGHAALGSVDWRLLALLLAGSLPGVWLGAQLMTRVHERLLRSALSVLLAWAGSKLVAI